MAFVAPVARAAPSTARFSATPVSACAPRLFSTDTSTASSPATNRRGTARRDTSSLVTSIFASVSPTSVASVAPRAVARQVVRLSGQRNDTLARPSAPVCTAGAQNATSRKSLRTSSRPPLSAPP